jgi:undecaprenyl pyrophosphate synthase
MFETTIVAGSVLMDKPTSNIEAMGRRISSARRHHIFILPPLTLRLLDDLTILILADGNRRSYPSGGYTRGARRVVSIAEHFARRRDIATMIACILSPDNIAKRSDDFFFELYKEFIELGIAIETRGALVAERIRMELWGDLGSLRARGGHGAALADAIEAVAEMTASVVDPKLRLILGVGYGPDTAQELDVDIVVRTGMEEEGVLRLSGLRTGEGIVNYAMTTLWPEVEPRDMDEAIEICKRRASARFAGGHSISMVVNLIETFSKAQIDAPLRVTIPTSAPPRAIAEALDRLYAGPLRDCTTSAVEYAGDERESPLCYGPGQGAQHELCVVGGSPWERRRCEGSFDAVLAPGQEPPSFTLPGWLPLGSANVHACPATVEGMVRSIREAQRFAAIHPPLLGRDRGTGRTTGPRAPVLVETHAGVTDRDELADRFTGKTLQWAASAGLLLPHAAWQKAAANYALTAFFIHFRIPTEWDETGALWEERADLTAKYMLLVAAGDEGIFDCILDGETPEQRWVRLEASSRFLQGTLQIEGARPSLPRVPGTDLLTAIAGEWRALFDRYQRSCSSAAAASFRAGLADLYAASLAEHRAGFASRLLAGLGEDPAHTALIERRFYTAPPIIATRARALVGDALGGGRRATNELLALLYLTEVASAVGAGLLFRAAALTAPSSNVTSRRIHHIEAVATLLDYHVRLSNDLSGILEAPGGDRDPKENACTILVPQPTSGAMRAVALIQALATCRQLAAWVDHEVGGRIDHLAAVWPWMGTIVRRGAFIGRRVYELGHYTTISRAAMSAIFVEADRALIDQSTDDGR